MAKAVWLPGKGRHVPLKGRWEWFIWRKRCRLADWLEAVSDWLLRIVASVKRVCGAKDG